VTIAPRLDRFALGRPLRLAVRWPSATGLTSYLSGCFSLTSQRSRLDEIAGVSEGAIESLPAIRYLPGVEAHFVPPFGVFRKADLVAETAELSAPCWRTVATVLPSG